MNTFDDVLMSVLERLLGRAGGPLHFRLMIMPLVVTFFAVRAAMKDVRSGQPPFFRTLVGHPEERGRLIRSLRKDIGKIIIMAIVLDTSYQLLVLKAFYPGELLFVVLASALMPYLVIRSAVWFLMRRIYGRQSKKANAEAGGLTKTPPCRDTQSGSVIRGRSLKQQERHE
jgi:hypothetical protein